MFNGLVVPVAVWGKQPLSHVITSVLMMPGQKYVVTGCDDGHICVWNQAPSFELSPKLMLFGHSSSVTCLAVSTSTLQDDWVVSSSDNGEMCLWDLADGRCIESIKSSSVHMNIQTHQMLQTRENKLICNGYYPEIFILHATRLSVIFTLTSIVQPDWVIAVCVLRPVKQEDDVILAVTNSGLIKLWRIPVTELRQGIGLFESESKQTRCVNARMIRSCIYNQRTVLIVCTKYWQLFDASDFSLLCSESSSFEERWMGGDFIEVNKVLVWSDKGKGYLYTLPPNPIIRCTLSSNPTFRQQLHPSSTNNSSPSLYRILDIPADEPHQTLQPQLTTLPVLSYVIQRRETKTKILLRGDSNGRVSIWKLPDQQPQVSLAPVEVCAPNSSTSLKEQWKYMCNEGLIDHLSNENKNIHVTCTVFIALHSRVACGRSDGSIVVVSATKALRRLFFSHQPQGAIPHHTLLGHQGRVNCLLYPSNESTHHDNHILVSGGQDFCVIVWDLRNVCRLYSFCVQGGEVLQLIVPSSNCSSRVQTSICSIASDNSLALLSLKERKCILLATRHIFPILLVKFRPLDDFVVVACTDGTVYVWQMETGHLDRVVHGAVAEDIMLACEEKSDEVVGHKSNPQISIGQALKRHNVASFKHLAQQHLKKAQDAMADSKAPLNKLPHPSLVQKSDTLFPLMVQSLSSVAKNTDSHVVYFNTETIIVQLLSEEYSNLSPASLEKMGFYTKVTHDQGFSETQKMVYDIMSKVKRKADTVSHKIHTKVDTTKLQQQSSATPSDLPLKDKQSTRDKLSDQSEEQEESHLNSTLLICQLLISCLHGWELDKSIDEMCLKKLGFLKPRKSIPFGYLSSGGQLSLTLPSCATKGTIACQAHVRRSKNPFLSHDDEPSGTFVGHPISPLAFEVFPSPPIDFSLHFQVSNALTTQHLLSVISLTNTLMAMSNVSFNQLLPPSSPLSLEEPDGFDLSEPELPGKQGWSLVASLHCVLLPDLAAGLNYKPPLLEMLARRWQDRCLEIREAAQALLLAELRRLGPEGGKKVIDDWSPYLPYNLLSVNTYVPTDMHNVPNPSQPITYIQTAGGGVGGLMMAPGVTPDKGTQEEEEEDEDGGILGGSEGMGTFGMNKYKYAQQATGIVMLGVIGFEFGASITRSSDNIPEGFSFTNNVHARNTSKALANLLLQPAQHNVATYSLMRRAAVDLLGRGFVVWEPYLDVSSILVGLLELCIDGDKLVPSSTFGLPLTPKADACRTARHSLTLVATAKPATFITTMVREVARYNAMVQNAQAQQYQYSLHAAVLSRAKPEILRILQIVVEKAACDVVDHLSELTDIVVHCLDANQVKNRGLKEIFPAYCKKFPMVDYCSSNRRIAVGNVNGSVIFYDLRQGKSQTIKAHSGRVHSVSYSPDAKTLASFSLADKKIHFWQTTSTSLFGIGAQQVKCIKTYTSNAPDTPATLSPLKYAQIIWVNPRTVSIVLWDKSEARYRL